MSDLDFKQIEEALSSKFSEYREGYEDISGRVHAIEMKMVDSSFLSKEGDEKGMTKGDLEAFGNFLYKGDVSGLETKDVEIGTSGQGQELAYAQWSREVIAALGEDSSLLNFVRHEITTAHQYDKVYSTSRSSTGWAAEKATRSATTTPNFSTVSIPLYTLYAYPALTEESTLGTQFSGLQAEGIVRADVTQAYSETLAQGVISGSGSSQLTGILNNMTSNSPATSPQQAFGEVRFIPGTGSPEAISYAALLDVMSALPIRHRANARWFMSTAAVEATRSLLDGNNLPIWRNDFGVVGAPLMLLGKEVIEVPQLDSQTYQVLYGDMEAAYSLVVHASGTRIVRDEVTTPGYIKLIVSMYVGGKPTDTTAIIGLRGV